MKVRFILSFLAALFIAGNMIAIESTERVERKLPLVLKEKFRLRQVVLFL